MPYRVAVVLQELTDTPGRWKTTDTRLVTDLTDQTERLGVAQTYYAVAIIAAQHSVGMLAEAQR